MTERRAGDETYRDLVDLAPVAMFVDREGTILYANDAGVELLGAADRDALAGRPVYAFVDPEEEDAVRGRIRRVEDRREPTEVETVRLVREDGEERIGTVRSIPVSFEGEPASLSIIQDVTEQRRVRRALRESERRFRSLFEDLHAAVYRTTRDGAIVQANPAMVEMFGHEREALEGLDVRELYVDADDRLRFQREIEDSGFVKDFEVALQRRDGTELTCLLTATPWRDEEGQVGGYQGVIRDVTEKRRLEAALREREERYRRLVEAVDVVPWEMSLPDWTFTYVAPQVEEIFGYAQEAWYEPGFWPEHLHQEDRDEAVSFCRQQTSEGEDHEIEYRFRHADGHAVWVRDIVSVVQDEGEPRFLRGVMLDVTRRKHFEERLEEQALRDELTGLPNRTLFWDRLEQALARVEREGSALAVLFIDLDRFKRINDSLGHVAGDRVLVEVAHRLESTFREEDTVARFGGDEFAVVVEEVERENDATRAAERFLRALDEAIQVDGERLYLTASVGVTLAGALTGREGHGEGGDELVQRADQAMFRAKSQPGGAVHVLDPDEELEGGERIQRERELREGIEKGQFRTVYQPVVRIEDGAVLGAEALARWEHPERGRVGPSEFIPLAEETGLIVPLGESLMEEALHTLGGWIEAGLAPPNLTMSLNLSARQFQDPELTESVERLLNETGLEPIRVFFEVTERLAMRGSERVDQVRALGVRIAVDDFGTGYSSLHYLQRLDVNSLKIDRSFVEGLGGEGRDEAIVRTILTLGEELGLEVVAEGIEREDQRRILLELGCRMGQGFHFARPLSADEFARRLTEGVSAADATGG